MKWAEAKVGKLTYVSWRNKFTGWHDSWAMAIDGTEHGEPVNWHESYNLLIRGKKTFLNSRLSQGDMFYRLFLSDACLGKACYEKCKYKYDQSSADIRIGDAWGCHYKEDEKGVSAAIAFTEKGNELLQRCNCQLEELPFDVVAEWQMKTNPRRESLYNDIMQDLKEPMTPIDVSFARVMTVIKRKKWMDRFRNPFRSIKNLLRKIW